MGKLETKRNNSYTMEGIYNGRNIEWKEYTMEGIYNGRVHNGRNIQWKEYTRFYLLLGGHFCPQECPHIFCQFSTPPSPVRFLLDNPLPLSVRTLSWKTNKELEKLWKNKNSLKKTYILSGVEEGARGCAAFSFSLMGISP